MNETISTIKKQLDTPDSLRMYMILNKTSFESAQIFLGLAQSYYAEGNLIFCSISLDKLKDAVIQSTLNDILEPVDQRFLSTLSVYFIKYKLMISENIQQKFIKLKEDELYTKAVQSKGIFISALIELYGLYKECIFLCALIENSTNKEDITLFSYYLLNHKELILEPVHYMKLKEIEPLILLFISDEVNVDFIDSKCLEEDLLQIFNYSVQIDDYTIIKELLENIIEMENLLTEVEKESVKLFCVAVGNSTEDIFYEKTIDRCVEFLQGFNLYARIKEKIIPYFSISSPLKFKTYLYLNLFIEANNIYKEEKFEITDKEKFKLFIGLDKIPAALTIVENMESEQEFISIVKETYRDFNFDILKRILILGFKKFGSRNFVFIKYTLTLLNHENIDLELTTKAGIFLSVLKEIDLRIKDKNIWLFDMTYNYMVDLIDSGNILLLNFIDLIEEYKIISSDYLIICLSAYDSLNKQGHPIKEYNINKLYDLYTVLGIKNESILKLLFGFALKFHNKEKINQILLKIHMNLQNIKDLLKIESLYTYKYIDVKIKIYTASLKYKIFTCNILEEQIMTLISFGPILLLQFLKEMFNIEKDFHKYYSEGTRTILLHQVDLLKQTRNIQLINELEKYIK